MTVNIENSTDQYRFQLMNQRFFRAPLVLTVLPQQALVVGLHPPPPAQIYFGEQYNITLTPTASANFSGVNVTLYFSNVPYQTLHLPPNTRAPVIFQLVGSGDGRARRPVIGASHRQAALHGDALTDECLVRAVCRLVLPSDVPSCQVARPERRRVMSARRVLSGRRVASRPGRVAK